MADNLPDVWWKEFGELGEEEVRKRLGAHIWLEDKEKLARQWLQSGEAAKAAENRRDALALAKEANDIARAANDVERMNNFIAALVLVGAGIAIAVSIIGLFLRR
jgi:hypothetical protein